MVEVVVGGSSFAVEAEVGLGLFERNRDLLAAGRTEAASVELPGPPKAVLRLLLGVHAVSVIEVPEAWVGADAPALDSGSAVEVFPDFDVYH